MRSTSIKAYNEIKENGLLSKRRFEVYDYLYHHGAKTQNEVARYYQKLYPNAGARSWGARFAELKELGVIKEVGTKADSVSGHTTILWDVTENLPANLPPKKTKHQNIIELLDELAEEKNWEIYLRVKEATGVKHNAEEVEESNVMTGEEAYDLMHTPTKIDHVDGMKQLRMF